MTGGGTRVSYMHGRKLDGSCDLPPKPLRVAICYDRFKAMLNLPIAFELLDLPKIYALFKLIKQRPGQNEKAFEVLDQFFPAWLQGFFDAFTKAALQQWDAGKISGYAETEVRKTKKAKEALDRCRRIIKAYEAAKPQKKQGLIGA